MGNIALMNVGGSVVYPSPGFDGYKAMKAIQDEKCTTVYGVPTMFFSFLEEQEKHNFDVSSLSKGIISGSIIPGSLVKSVKKVMNIENLTVSYGMTEASPVVLQTRIGDSFKTITETVGRIYPN